MTHVKSILSELNRRLSALHREEAKLKDAIRTISSLNGEEPKPTSTPKKFVRRTRFKVTCTSCGKLFTAKRNPTAYGKGNSFCHKPCTASSWRRDLSMKATAPGNGPTSSSSRGVRIVPGDPLRASH